MTALASHLAQFNLARMRAPIDEPLMLGFRSQLDVEAELCPPGR